MKKNFLGIIVLLFLIQGCKKNNQEASTLVKKEHASLDFSQIFSAEETKVSPEIPRKIAKYYQKVWEDGDLWGGILVAKGNRILYENYRGYYDVQHSRPIQADTPLHVASISKSLTAVAIMKLVEAGKINLKDEVITILPDFPYSGITLQSLLTQRSGLPKYEHFQQSLPKDAPIFMKEFWTNSDILDALKIYKPELARTPETGFMYCNTNYAILAIIIEKITEKTFPNAMKELLFEPLQMKNSYIFQKKNFNTAARSFYQKSKKEFPYDQFDLIYGDKNLYTTPRDLLNFSMALYSKKFLSETSLQKIFHPYSLEKPGINNYGIGFRMKVYEEGQILPYHTGWWHGTNSVMGHLLDEKVTIVSIGNKFSKGPYSALSLASLFGNYPIEKMKFELAMGETPSKVALPDLGNEE